MSILRKTPKPPFFAVIFTSPPRGYEGENFGEKASMLVAFAAMEPGYLGFEAEYATEGRKAAVCYWDSYAALERWKRNAEGWMSGKTFDMLLCTTGCLWPWLLEERRVELEPAARNVA